jgi:hypothetical protein
MRLEALRTKYDGVGKSYDREEVDHPPAYCEVSIAMCSYRKKNREDLPLDRQFLIYPPFILSQSSFKLIRRQRLFLPLEILNNGTSE